MTNEEGPPKYLTLAAVGHVLDISRGTVRNKILKGQILGVDIGTGDRPRWRVSEEALRAYCARIEAEAAERIEKSA